MKIYSLLLAFLFFIMVRNVNYVSNGEFENPPSVFSLEVINPGSGYMPFWDGKFDVLTFSFRGFDLGSGQYIDLSTVENGYI